MIGRIIVAAVSILLVLVAAALPAAIALSRKMDAQMQPQKCTVIVGKKASHCEVRP